MRNSFAVIALMTVATLTTASAQTQKPAAPGSVLHDITINADRVYTGTLELNVAAGKVTGKMKLTVPTEITGDVAGTAQAGALDLQFPYHIPENACDGTVKMKIQLPATPGLAKGTMEAVGCGRDEGNKLAGSVELKPVVAKK